MQENFRSLVFKLQKKLLKDDSIQQIGQMIREMSIDAGNGENNPHKDFAYVAKRSNNEFYGFLYYDDILDELEISSFFEMVHLEKRQRNLIENGHKTITRFIELCLSDIAIKSDKVANLINPYSFKKEVVVAQGSSSLLADEDMADVAVAFKKGNVYKTLMTTNAFALLNDMPINECGRVISILEKEINDSLGEDIVEDLRNFSLKLQSNLNKIPDILLAELVLIVALRMALKISCQLLYRAICGIDLFVLNKKNIISIDKRKDTVICRFYKVLSQNSPLNFWGGDPGSILLIDCETPSGIKLHEFGMVVAKKFHYDREFGSLEKYSFVSVDEAMIPFSNLVNAVLRIGLPDLD